MNQKSLDKKKTKELECWEKEFDKKFGNNLELNEGMIGTAVEEYHSNATRKVKNFISKTLTQQRKELLEEIKTRVETWGGFEDDGGNLCHDDSEILEWVNDLLNKKDE